MNLNLYTNEFPGTGTPTALDSGENTCPINNSTSVCPTNSSVCLTNSSIGKIVELAVSEMTKAWETFNLNAFVSETKDSWAITAKKTWEAFSQSANEKWENFDSNSLSSIADSLSFMNPPKPSVILADLKKISTSSSTNTEEQPILDNNLLSTNTEEQQVVNNVAQSITNYTDSSNSNSMDPSNNNHTAYANASITKVMESAFAEVKLNQQVPLMLTSSVEQISLADLIAPVEQNAPVEQIAFVEEVTPNIIDWSTIATEQVAPKVTISSTNAEDQTIDGPKSFDINSLPAYSLPIAVGVALVAVITGVGMLYKNYQNKKIASAKEAAEAAIVAAEQEKQNAIQNEIKRAAQLRAELARNELLSQHSKNEQTLTELGLTNWSIPIQGLEDVAGSHQVAPNTKKIVFNSETKQMVETVKSMITQSVDTKGDISLPNLLIQGESGVGKTMLTRDLIQFASEKGAGYIVIPSKMFEEQLILGNHVMAFQRLLAVANTAKLPVYFIFENGEELFKQRPKDQKNIVEARRVELENAFLDLTGEDRRKVSILMTTQEPNKIDEAFNTRVTPIVLQLPGAEERRKIFSETLTSICNNDEKLKRFFSLARIEHMSHKTDGFTCDELNALLKTILDCIRIKNQMDQGIIDSSIELVRNKSIAR